MNTLQLDLPEGCKVSNHLYPSMEVGYFLEDLVCVELADGSIIDAGWYPEHDPIGHYVVRYYRGGWPQNVELLATETVICRTPENVKEAIEAMANR